MKCHAGVEYPSGKPCPKCGAKLGEVCWPGINQDLMDVQRLRTENERLHAVLLKVRNWLDVQFNEPFKNGELVEHICSINDVLPVRSDSPADRNGET